MAETVRILGNGLAACCVARLLCGHDVRLALDAASLPLHPRPASLLLSRQTQSLLQDIFDDAALFEGASRIRRRIVRWGQGDSVVELPHDGAVVSEVELLNRLWKMQAEIAVDAAPRDDSRDGAAWEILTSGRSVIGQAAQHLRNSQTYGLRTARTVAVVLVPDAPNGCCWIESIKDGWLFLLPTGKERGAALIACGADTGRLIGQSNLVVEQIEELDTAVLGTPQLSTAPRILDPLCGAGWIACGSAAMQFDPLCGEGAGHAAREALLASAVIKAAAKGFDIEELLAHYATRLRQGFLRHLEVCLGFYQSGGESGFWKSEEAALKQGIAFVREQLPAKPHFSFRLVGTELQPLASV